MPHGSRHVKSSASCAALALALGLAALHPALAWALQPSPAGGNTDDAYDLSPDTAFERAFHELYPQLPCRDAPTVLHELGLICRYSIVEFGTQYGKRWRFAGKRGERHTPTDRLEPPPTAADARQLLALSGLDMDEILQYRELGAADRRDELVALLTRYIEPDMDLTNRKSLEGYDPAMCINEAGDHVYRLDVDEGVLNDVRRAAHLLHAGRHDDYRKRLLELLAEHPRLSLIHVGLGNSYFAQGDLAQAQQWYRRGAAANPMNPMLGYSMAFCFLAQGDADRAIDSLTRAFMVCRTNVLVWLALDTLLTAEGGRAVDLRFRDRTYVTPGLELVRVEKGMPPGIVECWLYYGAAEIALNHSRGELMTVFDGWDIQECEAYKVIHLLGRYLMQKRMSNPAYDPYLESLREIYDSGYLKEYVLFEMIAPYTRYYLTSLLTGEDEQKLRRYVERYVTGRP